MPDTVPLPSFVKHEEARRINATLLEGLFFHRSDNPSLYDKLYQAREEFKDAWQKGFGIELVVKQDVAYRRHINTNDDPYSGFVNPLTPNDGRLHFYWSGPRARLCFLIFQRFLYWYETELRRRPPQKYGEFDFQDHEFWVWVNEELTRFFEQIPNKPKPVHIHEAFRIVLDDMRRFGFIRVVDEYEVPEEERPRLKAQNYRNDIIRQYVARPGLTAYDPKILQEDPTVFRRSFTVDDQTDDAQAFDEAPPGAEE